MSEEKINHAPEDAAAAAEAELNANGPDIGSWNPRGR